MKYLIPISGLIAAVLLCVPASAEIFDQSKPSLDRTQEELFKSSFLTVDVPVPYIKPKLADISRNQTYGATDLINRFFGGQGNVTDKEQIVHPVWGNGTRYKSGMVLRLVESGSQTINNYEDMEIVPAFLDVYSRGFVYQNNVPHQPVVKTDVEITGTYSADIDTYNSFNEKEGRTAVERLISQMFGDLQVPSGFQSIVLAGIQDKGERLFSYYAYPEFIAPVEVPDVKGGNTIVESGVPVLDVYCKVLMDGDRNLVGMEYFWDNGIKASGGVKDCYSANQALVLAREAIYKSYDKHPPLLTITNIKLGYYQSRTNSGKLEPGWLFDAWYSQKRDQLNTRGTTTFQQYEYVNVPMPFAVNAITGEYVEL
ncbi:hypothetical protein KDL29_03590 [bacterium]|nr:hypothetical protein [bacterium]